MNKKIIIISANSDIGLNLCRTFVEESWEVYGTYRSQTNVDVLVELGVQLFQLDMSQSSQIERVAIQISKSIGKWDVLINATGMQSPIGKFENVNIDEWIDSVNVNFLSQIKMTYYLLPLRKTNASIIFFAGGGTNNAVMNYSAYTISKVSLIKSCEILDYEISDAAFSIVGPGWVKTRIHNETLNAGEGLAGENYHTTEKHLHENIFTPMKDVISSIKWIIEQPKEIVGGRNFSTVYDKWGSDELVTTLAGDNDMYKLRRNGNNFLVANKSTRN